MASSQENLTSSAVSSAAAAPESPMPHDSDAIAILAALLCGGVCLAGIAIVIRCAWLRRQRRRSSSPPPPTKGVEVDLLSSLPTLSFDPSSSSPSLAGDCPICLGEFTGGDRIRALPGCSHAFHAHCVDAWLVLHSSCPSCRRPIATSCNSSAASAAGAEAKERAVYRFLP